MGLIVEVFKNPLGDCTNSGISSKVTGLTLVNVSGPFEPNNLAPAALLIRGNAPRLVKIVPARRNGDNWEQASGWWMMGGNYAATSDSRFHRAVEGFTGGISYGAVPIHDRQE